MSKTDSKLIYKELSYKVIGAAMKVHSTLGSMLPEHCYEAALQMELTKQGILTVRQKQHEVFYDGVRCGHFFTDLVVEDKIVLELKSLENIFPHQGVIPQDYLLRGRARCSVPNPTMSHSSLPISGYRAQCRLPA